MKRWRKCNNNNNKEELVLSVLERAVLKDVQHSLSELYAVRWVSVFTH